MQHIDFSCNDPDAIAKAALKTRALSPQEACIFYYDHETPLAMQLTFLRKAIRRSTRVVWTVSEAMARDEGFLRAARELKGLFALSVRFSLNPASQVQHTGRNFTGDAQVLNRYAELREANKDYFEMIPEIELGQNLDDLGPTLIELAKTQPRWIVLYVEDPPDDARVTALKNCFEYLQMRSFPLVEIHFPFGLAYSTAWKVMTGCFFSGPQDVHLDISNKCTHSCNFCAVYSPGTIQEFKEKGGGQIAGYTRDFMNAQLPFERAKKIIESLPPTTRTIQFGGAGDPMTHPQALEMLAMARDRGFGVELLTNMEYFSDEDLARLTEIGGLSYASFRLIANVSAATPETYAVTRPRQNGKTFHKVIASLRRLAELREKNYGWGVHFDLMCVTTRQNYHEALDYVRLAHSIGARAVWFKPIEVHHRSHYDLLPGLEEQADYRRILKAAFALAADLGLVVELPLVFPEPRVSTPKPAALKQEPAHV